MLSTSPSVRNGICHPHTGMQMRIFILRAISVTTGTSTTLFLGKKEYPLSKHLYEFMIFHQRASAARAVVLECIIGIIPERRRAHCD